MALTAGGVGGKLLDEVEEGSLSELLQALRKEAPHEYAFNIPQIDRIVSVLRQCAPSSTHNRPPVLELVSSSPAAGKTHLLYVMVAEAVLPSPVKYSNRHQHPGTVVLIDTDNRFDISRLADVVTTHYHANHPSAQQQTRPQQQEDTITIPSPVFNALRHIHVFRPASLNSLITTLFDLPKYLLDLPQHHSAHRPLTLLAVDSISAFYWQTRFAQESAHLSSQVVGANPHADLVSALRTVQETFDCPVVATTWALSSKPSPIQGGSPSLRPLLPAVWQGFVSVRMSVRREPVKKFHGEMTLEMCERDKGQRMDEVKRGIFRTSVDGWGIQDWGTDVRKTLLEKGVRGGFVFQIDDAGIRIEE